MARSTSRRRSNLLVLLRGSARLALATAALTLGARTATADEAASVHVRLSAEGDARRPELLLEREGAIVASCPVACDLVVPRGRYRLRVLREGDQFVHDLDVDHALDVQWERGAPWRRWLGITLGIGGSLVFAYESTGDRNTATGKTHYSWQALTLSGLVAAGGFVLAALSGSGEHLNVSARPAQAPPVATLALAPTQGGAALLLAGTF